MKNLANCKPSEFLVQTNRIRKAVEKWLNDTGIPTIRKTLPELKVAPVGVTDEERKQIIAENEELLKEQARKNTMAIFEAAMEKCPEETLEILGLLCFVEADDIDNHPINEYLSALNDLMNDAAVVGFFTSLVQLGQTATSSR